MGRHGTALILAMCVQVTLIHAADWPQFCGPNRSGRPHYKAIARIRRAVRPYKPRGSGALG